MQGVTKNLHEENLFVIGTGIRLLRHLKGWSCQKLADECGKQKHYISNIENRKTPVTVKSLSIMLSAFDMSLKDFFLFCNENNI